MYMLGYCNAFAVLKNDMYKYFCKDDKNFIDEIIKLYRQDKKMDELFGKILKNEIKFD